MATFVFAWDRFNDQALALNLDQMAYSSFDGVELVIHFEKGQSWTLEGDEAVRVWNVIRSLIPREQSDQIERIPDMKYAREPRK